MYEFVTFCVTVSIIIGFTTIGAVAGALIYFNLHKQQKPDDLHLKKNPHKAG